MAQKVVGSSPTTRPVEPSLNKVEAARLFTLDLEKLLPLPPLGTFDIATFLEEGLLLREKPFRQALEKHDWTSYEGCAVAIHTSTEAIVPPWAYLLVGKYLASYAVYYAVCRPEELPDRYRLDRLEKLDWTAYTGKRLLLRGCSSVSPAVLTEFFRRAMPFAQLIFYGEACSSVPVYKKAKP